MTELRGTSEQVGTKRVGHLDRRYEPPVSGAPKQEPKIPTWCEPLRHEDPIRKGVRHLDRPKSSGLPDIDIKHIKELVLEKFTPKRSIRTAEGWRRGKYEAERAQDPRAYTENMRYEAAKAQGLDAVKPAGYDDWKLGQEWRAGKLAAERKYTLGQELQYRAFSIAERSPMSPGGHVGRGRVEPEGYSDWKLGQDWKAGKQAAECKPFDRPGLIPWPFQRPGLMPSKPQGPPPGGFERPGLMPSKPRPDVGFDNDPYVDPYSGAVGGSGIRTMEYGPKDQEIDRRGWHYAWDDESNSVVKVPNVQPMLEAKAASMKDAITKSLGAGDE
jgi:hypothetical protein